MLQKQENSRAKVKTIQRICQVVGKQAMDNRHRITLGDANRVDDRVILVCIDGGRLRELKAKRGRRPAGQNAKAT